MTSIEKMFRISYWKIFRLVFVIFSLYLIGDAFFRWDGFKYYGYFSDFIFNVALAAFLFSILAAFYAFLLWIISKIFELLWYYLKWNLDAEILQLFLGCIMLLGMAVWIGKQQFVSGGSTLEIKIAVLSFVVISAVIITWFFRNKAKQWIDILQDRITPLVWLFGICILVSSFMVAYIIVVKPSDDVLSSYVPHSSNVNKSRPNIILFTFDALTARDMSAFGYYRETTPFISKWAKSATLFRMTEADSNFTSSTAASLVTGKRVWNHQTYHRLGSKPIASNVENFALELKNNGYYNISYIENNAAGIQAMGIARSFHKDYSHADFSDFSEFYRRINSVYSVQHLIQQLIAPLFVNKIRIYDWIVKPDFKPSIILEIINPIYEKLFISRRVHKNNVEKKTEKPYETRFGWFFSEIEKNNPKPFFAWLHLLPPHDPYFPGEPYVGMFDSSTRFRFPSEQKKEIQRIRSLHEYSDEDKDIAKILRARYDEYIRYSDQQFEEFINQLKKRTILDNTIIILSADHGESFEHEYLIHGHSHLYEQVTNIPLIIKKPGQSDGKIISDVVEQIDIPATILELAGISVPEWMEGRSLVPLMRNEKLPPRPTFSMNFEKNRSVWHQISNGTIAVWEGDYKLIHYLENKKTLLFNFREDPDELINLFDKKPDEAQRMLELINQHLKEANDYISKNK